MTEQTKMWKYLQEKVMGECWHKTSKYHGNPYCAKCYSLAKNRDFSQPTDYCALEGKMRELGEWLLFVIWLEENNIIRDYVLYAPTQRAELIYEYWKQKEEPTK